MTQLTTTKGISPELKTGEIEIVKARHGVARIKFLAKPDAVKSLLEIIIRCHHRLRYTLPVKKEDLHLMSTEFYKDIEKYAGTLTIQELDLACMNGCNGLYGEFMGLSNATFIKWVMNYMVSDERKRALKKQADFENPPPKAYTDQEKEKIIHDTCMLLFGQFKSKNYVYDAGNVNYKYLDRKGKIPFTPERKREFVKKAQEILQGEVTLDHGKNAQERTRLRELINRYADPKSDPVLSKAMELALNAFFGDLVETGTELKDLFENE